VSGLPPAGSLRFTLAAPDENVFIEGGKKRASRHSVAALPQKPAGGRVPAPCLDGILCGVDDMEMTSGCKGRRRHRGRRERRRSPGLCRGGQLVGSESRTMSCEIGQSAHWRKKHARASVPSPHQPAFGIAGLWRGWSTRLSHPGIAQMMSTSYSSASCSRARSAREG